MKIKMCLLKESPILTIWKIGSKLILPFLLILTQIQLFGQCPPSYKVKGDTTITPGKIILTASGCKRCTYEWMDNSFITLTTGPVLQQNNTGNNLYYLTVTDTILGCNNYNAGYPSYPDSIYAYPSINGYTRGGIPGDPTIFGDGVWNVYCYNDEIFNAYAGYYVDNSDFNSKGVLTVNSITTWANGCMNCNPSPAPDYIAIEASPFIINQNILGTTYNFMVNGYQGEEINVDHHGISYKRKNFPAGYYRLDITNHSNKCWIYVNGVKVFEHDGYNHGHDNVWSDYLDGNSTVEFSWINNIGSSRGMFSITKLPGKPALTASSVSDQTICPYSKPAPIGALFPFGDSYVSNGFPNSNYGNSVTDTLINCTQFGQGQMGIISFDLSSLNETSIQSAELNFTALVDDCPTCYTFIPTPVSIKVLNDTSWNEYDVTWNKLKFDSFKDTLIGIRTIYQVYKTRYHYDVTSYIQKQYAAGARKIAFSFTMNLVAADTTKRTVKFFSKEVGNASDKPFLLINGTQTNLFNSPIYQWEIDSTQHGQNWSTFAGATDCVFAPPTTQKDSVCYRLKMNDQFGQTTYSDTILISTGSNYGYIQRVEYNETNKAMQVQGYSGSIVRWESSPLSNFSTIHPINETSNILNSSNGNDSYYRAVIYTNSSYRCSEIYRLYPDFRFYSSISPNHDGTNDTWIIDGIENFPTNNVKIFNRLGILEYSEEGYNNIDKVWKGNTNISSNQHTLPDGTYFYDIEIFNKPVKSGFIELRR